MPPFVIDVGESSWAGKTYEEIREVGESDGSILVVPVGSVEQHGHHLPTGTDTVLCGAIAGLGVERLDDVPVLVAPPVWNGYSPHHLAFGGTLSGGFETLLAQLGEVADGGLANGFDALVLLNGHGGNASLVDAAVSEIGVDHPEAEVLGLTYFALAAPFVDEIRDSDAGGMGHGGEFETSLLLHLAPELVRTERIDGTTVDEPYDRSIRDLFDAGPLSVYRSFADYSASGAVGEPGLASAEKGAEFARRLGDELADLLREIHDRNAA